MSIDIPKITPIGRICNTSVYDASLTIRQETDVKILRLALQYEKFTQRRATQIRMLDVRIRKLEVARD